MDEKLILAILKQDLQIMTPKMDTYLKMLISAAAQMITREGIELTDCEEDGLLREMYAAYLYRKRKENTASMPRMLRWALNNRLLSQKMSECGGEKNG